MKPRFKDVLIGLVCLQLSLAPIIDSFPAGTQVANDIRGGPSGELGPVEAEEGSMAPTSHVCL